MLPEASLGIIVCGDNELQETDFWIQDCSAATENILIAAHALGLGTVWLGVYPVETLVTNTREVFGIPSHVTPLGIIAVGYPCQEKPPANRYNEERVHRDTW
jgi:nitroreductase